MGCISLGDSVGVRMFRFRMQLILLHQIPAELLYVGALSYVIWRSMKLRISSRYDKLSLHGPCSLSRNMRRQRSGMDLQGIAQAAFRTHQTQDI